VGEDGAVVVVPKLRPCLLTRQLLNKFPNPNIHNWLTGERVNANMRDFRLRQVWLTALQPTSQAFVIGHRIHGDLNVVLWPGATAGLSSSALPVDGLHVIERNCLLPAEVSQRPLSGGQKSTVQKYNNHYDHTHYASFRSLTTYRDTSQPQVVGGHGSRCAHTF